MPRGKSNVRTIVLTPHEKSQLKRSGHMSQMRRRNSPLKLRVPRSVLNRGVRSQTKRGLRGGSKRRRSSSKRRRSRSKVAKRRSRK